MFLQLDPEAKKKLEETQKELGALRAAVASAGEDASLDQACGGKLKNSVLELYTKNAAIKASFVEISSLLLYANGSLAVKLAVPQGCLLCSRVNPAGVPSLLQSLSQFSL